MIFNGIDLSVYFNVNPTRAIMPSVNIEIIDVPGKQGAIISSKKFEPLSIPVKVRLKAEVKDDISKLRRILAKALYTDEPAKLILPDEPDLYYMAVLRGSSELDNLWYTGSANLEFFCPDPIAFGATRKAEASANGFHVGGSWSTLPIITAKPAAGSYFRITNYYTGEFIQLTRAFNGTETVVIDCAKMHTTVNGMAAQVIPTSDYFELEPGKNRLTRSSGNATIQWQERWI